MARALQDTAPNHLNQPNQGLDRLLKHTSWKWIVLREVNSGGKETVSVVPSQNVFALIEQTAIALML